MIAMPAPPVGRTRRWCPAGRPSSCRSGWRSSPRRLAARGSSGTSTTTCATPRATSPGTTCAWRTTPLTGNDPVRLSTHNLSPYRFVPLPRLKLYYGLDRFSAQSTYWDTLAILLMHATWFDLWCVPTWVSGRFHGRKCKQASKYWSLFTFLIINVRVGWLLNRDSRFAGTATTFTRTSATFTTTFETADTSSKS